ncbi:hypothetical protein CEXT_329581 [Caerostris extrusa]|uniref:Uncharacterized protein n=1 Tax=Caerostris extrusa TaxID=172846 RepID=A0AAV4S5T1_CAEEX|nr:hypothetical protein CEXT_329581 [Caerostris extrusa]
MKPRKLLKWVTVKSCPSSSFNHDCMHVNGEGMLVAMKYVTEVLKTRKTSYLHSCSLSTATGMFSYVGINKFSRKIDGYGNKDSWFSYDEVRAIQNSRVRYSSFLLHSNFDYVWIFSCY